MGETSIVEYLSSHEGYKCGYCKSENTCFSHGMWADTLTPLDYQNLIDRGWRRSGKYVYKPTLHRTCCPQYTIRCEAKKFILSKSQKKVLKKVHKYLASGEKERSVFSESGQAMEQSDIHEAMDVQILQDIKDISKITRSDTDIIDSPNHTTSDPLLNQDRLAVPPSPAKSESKSESSHANVSTLKASTESNAEKPCRKAKELRRERKLQKLLSKGVPAEVALSSVQKKGSEAKTVEDFLSESFTLEQPLHKLELRLVPSSLDPMLETFEESYSVYKKYQMTIHKDPPEKCVKDQFIRFLVRNPFKQSDAAVSSQNSIYGSFHHQYWLDGKLIAIGVIDILPYCVSSVYFYYDPDYSHLSLGTYAALREIALTRELSKKYPNLQYYYMGFYIHSCVKMRYKGQYNPSYLLCPETYIFQPIEKCLPKLEISKYHRLDEDPNKEDCDGAVNLSEVLVLYNRRRYTYQNYLKVRKNPDDVELVSEYAGFVGKKCYKRILLYRSC